MICAADTWINMETYAKAKEEFLRSFLDLPNGIPSDDTFNRVFSSIDSEQFETCFLDWVSRMANLTDGEVIPIDKLSGEQSLMERSHLNNIFRSFF